MYKVTNATTEVLCTIRGRKFTGWCDVAVVGMHGARLI